MLNVKSQIFNFFSNKKMKKAGIFTKVAKRSCSARFFFCKQVSRFILVLTKIWLTPELKSQNVKMRNFCNGF